MKTTVYSDHILQMRKMIRFILLNLYTRTTCDKDQFF